MFRRSSILGGSSMMTMRRCVGAPSSTLHQARCFPAKPTVALCTGIPQQHQVRFNSTSSSESTSAASSSSTSSTRTIGTFSSKEEESIKIAKLLEEDPKLLEEVIAKMSGEQRRRFTVAGGAYEWFGKDKVSTELVAADVDKDKVISPKDFNNWFDNALKRHTDNLEKNPEATAGNNKDGSAKAEAGGKGASAKVPVSALLIIALETGLPFVGFGFLDNATMVLAGDAIDKSLGAFLHCSVMASAAMGNVVSGMMGMQVHGFIEKFVQKLGLPAPILTLEQQRSQPVFLAGHIGGTVGIAIGLTLGMLPLLFIGTEEMEEENVTRKWFDTLDLDHSGQLSATEVQKGLKSLGVDMPLEEVEQWIKENTPAGIESLEYKDFARLYGVLKGQVGAKA